MPHEKSTRIPDWSVQQAKTIEQCPIPPGTPFAITEKLNGVRATYFRGQLISRTGIPFTGLDHITEPINRIFGDTYVFDGELTLRDKSGLTDNEAFRLATGIINADSADKTVVLFTIFDLVPTAEFLADHAASPYFARRTTLDAIRPQITCDHVRILPVLYCGTDQTRIPNFLDQMVAEDKEGLIVNLNTPYQRKRHRGVLKVKRFYTMDLPVLAAVEGTGRLAGTLGALTVDFAGTAVNVGTGFTDEERNAIWANRASIPGTLCEVKYKEISKTKSGQSLQFPVFVRLRADKSDVSYG